MKEMYIVQAKKKKLFYTLTDVRCELKYNFAKNIHATITKIIV